MNKFKKPYSSRTSKSRTEGRPARRPRFGATPYAQSSGTRDTRGSRSETFQKFDAICSNCGKKCQVPFRPDGEKPVYCKNCFDMPRKEMTGKKKFSANSAPRFTAPTEAGSAGGKSIADLTRQIAAMNTKIDTMLKILEHGASEE